MPRKTWEELLAALAAEDDGLKTRSVGIWTLEKLATLVLYLPAYARACRAAGGGYYVDAFAGPGVDRIRKAETEPRIVWGSPMIALRAQPRLQKCVFLDIGKQNVDALQERCADSAGRAKVHRGDANVDLVPMLRQEVPSLAPCFCFLDPEGFELHWRTLEGLAGLPGRKRKPELMILFPLEMAFLRVLPVDRPPRAEDQARVSRVFRNGSWVEVHEARIGGEITPADAKRMYLSLYLKDIQSLGYESVFSRPVLAYSGPGRRRQARYHLIFATDHRVGEDIMANVFARPFVLDLPVSQQPPLLDT